MIPSLLAAATLVIAPVPESAEFDEWIVACDNGLHCEASAIIESGSTTANEWQLFVTRDAQALSSPEIDAYADAAQRSPKSVRLKIDGQMTGFGFDENGAPVGDSFALLRTLAKARKAEVIDDGGNVIGLLPVSGSSAALRWIDDRQKRAGSVTALVAIGPRPANSVPPPPPLPNIIKPPASDLPPLSLTVSDIAAIRSLGECDLGDRPNRVETYRLDAQSTLGIVPCFFGAYQGSAIIVVIDQNGKWRPATIEQPVKPREDAEPYWLYALTGAGYSDDYPLLTESAKGRGLGDCGRTASWVWDGEIFRLASYRAMDRCRGGAAGLWLLRWRTRNQPKG